jgi:hypothetical protein
VAAPLARTCNRLTGWPRKDKGWLTGACDQIRGKVSNGDKKTSVATIN